MFELNQDSLVAASPGTSLSTKLKAHVRKAAERIVSGLWEAIGRLIDLFNSQECANIFAAAGYDAI